MITYEEALNRVSQKIQDGVPYGSYEDEKMYYFCFLPKDEYDPNDKDKIYSSRSEFGINKNTGKIMQTDIIPFCMLFKPQKLDAIKKSFREIS